MSLCNVPGCYAFGRYCRLHSNTTTNKQDKLAVLKEENPGINKMSEKQKEQNKELTKIVKVKKKDTTLCQVKSPVCIGSPVHSHHIQGRVGMKMTNPDKIILACDPCNGYIEANSQWAIKNGFKESKHDKNYKRSKI